MLKKSRVANDYKNILLVGSTSEIGISIVNKLNLDRNSLLMLAGRESPSPDQFVDQPHQRVHLRYDFEVDADLERFEAEVKNLGGIDLAIVALGFLPQEHSDLQSASIKRAITINALAVPVVLSCLVEKMRGQASGDILYISSVATCRPRLQNFVYGSAKKCADFFTIGLLNKYMKSNVRIFILRPGFVFTKMSKGFEPAPFSINKAKVAEITLKGISRNQRIIYAPRKLRVIMPILSLIPRFIYDKLN
jgi:decaprenylphospho-beta-D-erythro-pentofuranosid-2-ulose 2-reductase